MRIAATLHITYEDDGLRLISPTPYFSGSTRVGTLFNEAGLIYVRTARTDCIALRELCTIDAVDSLPFPFVIGDNSFAESIQQEISVVAEVLNFNSERPVSATAFLGNPLAQSVQNPVTPVPEPDTIALLAAGLMALGLMTRRQSNWRGRRRQPTLSADAAA